MTAAPLAPGRTWSDVRRVMAELAYAVGRAHALTGRPGVEVYAYVATLRVHPIAESQYWQGFRDCAAGGAYASAIITARRADHDALEAVAA